MKGIFKIKNRDLWPIHDAIKQLATGFKKISYNHVPREFNKLADAAVNRGARRSSWHYFFKKVVTNLQRLC